MSVKGIYSLIECDGCGHQFKVSLDESKVLPPNWSLFDAAVDAVRGGIDHVPNLGIGHSTSVQDGNMLCPDCTKEYDKRKGEEE